MLQGVCILEVLGTADYLLVGYMSEWTPTFASGAFMLPILSQRPQPEASLVCILVITPNFPTFPHLGDVGKPTRSLQDAFPTPSYWGYGMVYFLLSVIKLFVLTDIHFFSHL